MMENRPRIQAGFTLLELMITVVVLTLLVTLALPGYRAYVIRANRTEGSCGLNRAPCVCETSKQRSVHPASKIREQATPMKGRK